MIEKLLKDLNLYYQQGLTPKWNNGKALAYRDAIIALQVKAGETSLPDECAANGSTGHHFTMTPNKTDMSQETNWLSRIIFTANDGTWGFYDESGLVGGENFKTRDDAIYNLGKYTATYL